MKHIIPVVLIGLFAACGGSDSAESQPASEATTIPSTVVSVTPTPVPSSAVETGDETAGEASDETETGTAAPAPAAPRPRRNTAESTPAPASGDIRDVDFDNFSYTIGFEEDMVVTTIDGLLEDSESFLWFSVLDVIYGDLDDDGRDEAVVTTGYHTGGSGRFGLLNIYAIEDDQVVLRGTRGTGDRADGGLAHVEIAGGQLVVWWFGTDQGACCPNMVHRQKLAMGALGLVVTESLPIVSWLSLDAYKDVDELKFRPGTSSAVVQAHSGDRESIFHFDAAAGQWLTINHSQGPRPTMIELIDLATETVLFEQVGGEFEAALPSSGLFEVRLGFDEANRGPATVVDVAITNAQAPTIPTWTAEVREIIVEDEPLVALHAAWPRFDTSDSGQLNSEIQRWLADQTDWWVAAALEYPSSDDELGGEYELTYSVAMVSDDLVSVHYQYYEYVCCRPYPNYGQKSLLLDMAERRVLGIGDVLDLNRLDEIHEIWVEAASRDPELLADPAFWISGERPGWASLILVPGGVEFGTDRQGAAGPTSTFVSWTELGGLANPEIVARSANGVVPAGFSPGE